MPSRAGTSELLAYVTSKACFFNSKSSSHGSIIFARGQHQGVIKDSIVEESLADHFPKSASVFGEPMNQSYSAGSSAS
jgi:hypothetical protein